MSTQKKNYVFGWMNTSLPIMPKEDEMKYKTSVFMGTSQDLFGSHKTSENYCSKSETFLYWG